MSPSRCDTKFPRSLDTDPSVGAVVLAVSGPVRPAAAPAQFSTATLPSNICNTQILHSPDKASPEPALLAAVRSSIPQDVRDDFIYYPPTFGGIFHEGGEGVRPIHRRKKVIFILNNLSICSKNHTFSGGLTVTPPPLSWKIPPKVGG